MAFYCPWTWPNRRRLRHSLLLRNDQHCPLPSHLPFTELPSSEYVSYVITSKWGPVSSPPTCPTRSLAFQIPEGTKPFPRLKSSSTPPDISPSWLLPVIRPQFDFLSSERPWIRLNWILISTPFSSFLGSCLCYPCPYPNLPSLSPVTDGADLRTPVHLISFPTHTLPGWSHSLGTHSVFQHSLYSISRASEWQCRESLGQVWQWRSLLRGGGPTASVTWS